MLDLCCSFHFMSLVWPWSGEDRGGEWLMFVSLLPVWRECKDMGREDREMFENVAGPFWPCVGRKFILASEDPSTFDTSVIAVVTVCLCLAGSLQQRRLPDCVQQLRRPLVITPLFLHPFFFFPPPFFKLSCCIPSVIACVEKVTVENVVLCSSLAGYFPACSSLPSVFPVLKVLFPFYCKKNPIITKNENRWIFNKSFMCRCDEL